MDNGKKEHAENGFEADYLYRKSKRIHAKKTGRSKSIKKAVNKRFRKRNKPDVNY